MSDVLLLENVKEKMNKYKVEYTVENKSGEWIEKFIVLEANDKQEALDNYIYYIDDSAYDIRFANVEDATEELSKNYTQPLG